MKNYVICKRKENLVISKMYFLQHPVDNISSKIYMKFKKRKYFYVMLNSMKFNFQEKEISPIYL